MSINHIIELTLYLHLTYMYIILVFHTKKNKSVRIEGLGSRLLMIRVCGFCYNLTSCMLNLNACKTIGQYRRAVDSLHFMWWFTMRFNLLRQYWFWYHSVVNSVLIMVTKWLGLLPSSQPMEVVPGIFLF